MHALANAFMHRFLKEYRSKMRGSSFRKSLLDGETNMLIYSGEITTMQLESNKLNLPGIPS